MRSADLEVQRALLAKLLADGALTASVQGRVVDSPADNSAFPYVLVGDAIQMPINAHDRSGRRLRATVDVWAQSRGFKLPKEIAARVVAALDHVSLSVDTWSHVVTRLVDSRSLRDPDPLLRRVSLQFDVLVQEAS